MSAGRIWLGLWLIGVAAAGGLGWNYRAARLKGASEVAHHRARQIALGEELARDEQRIARARAEAEQSGGKLAQLEKVASAAKVPKEVRPSGDSTKPQPPKNFSEFVKQSLLDFDRPDSQVRWFASLRAATQRRYAPLFRTLNLDALQREAFIANQAKLDESHSDLNAAALAQGFGTDDPAIVKLRGELYSSKEKAQRELLGEAGYRELKEFERTSSARDWVGNLAGLAAVTGMALTPVQTDQLLRAFVEASSAYRKGGRASVSDLDWPALHAAIDTIMSPEQRALFATQEVPGGAGGLFHARWSAEMYRATQAEAAKTAPKP